MTDARRDHRPDPLTGLLLDTSPYLSCDDCFAQLDRYVEQRLTDPDHHDLAMQVHLAGCGACADEAEALSELVTCGAEDDPVPPASDR